jgi:hypothetical protein
VRPKEKSRRKTSQTSLTQIQTLVSQQALPVIIFRQFYDFWKLFSRTAEKEGEL